MGQLTLKLYRVGSYNSPTFLGQLGEFGTVMELSQLSQELSQELSQLSQRAGEL